MAEDGVPYTEKPYRVVTTDGALLSGHDTLAQAQTRAEGANVAAEALGIQTRYEAIEKP